MKKFYVILSSFLFVLVIFLLKPASVSAGCDVQFCTSAECSQLRCNTCDFCLQCDDAFCTLAECTQQRCWGCSFCNPPRCDTQYCTQANCSESRCSDCSFCTGSGDPGGCQCSGPMSGPCTGVSINNCSSGYVAQCRTLAQCTLPNCDCVLESSVNCGHNGQACCSGNVCFSPATPSISGMGCACVVSGETTDFGGFRPALCSDGVSISTAIGCIPVNDTQAFTAFLLRWGIGIAGGIAFLLIIYAAFMIITSAGNPQRLQAGKELLTAAFMGLILLILSAFILRVIGKDILRIFP